MMSAVQNVLLTIWVGGLWAIGYIAAPTLFAVLDDRKIAGQLAGQMFQIINWLGLICGIALIVLILKRFGRVWQLWVILAMLILVATVHFALQPMMQEIKSQGLTPGSAAASQFGLMHGISSTLYLITSVLGLVVVAFGFEKKSISG